MPYIISSYSKQQARNLGVTIKLSKVKGKKLDVFKDGKKLASIGALGMGDFPTFKRKFGKEYADKRRNLYKMRHEKDRHKRGTAGYFADKILW